MHLLNLLTRALSGTVLLLALGFYFVVRPAAAQTEEEIEKAAAAMEKAADEFLSLIRDLNEEQWEFRSGVLRRSIGEEAEHVALAEHELQGVIDQAMQFPARPERAQELAGKEELVRDLMLNPNEPAERYKPKERLKTKAEVIEFFERAHRQALRKLRTTPDLGLHVARHPHKDYRDLTGLQWFYYIAYHNMRHCNQIKEIMADPNFPGGPGKSGS